MREHTCVDCKASPPSPSWHEVDDDQWVDVECYRKRKARILLLDEIAASEAALDAMRAERDALREAAERMAVFLEDTAREERWDFANCGEHLPIGPVWIGPNDEHPADLAQMALVQYRALSTQPGPAGGER